MSGSKSSLNITNENFIHLINLIHRKHTRDKFNFIINSKTPLERCLHLFFINNPFNRNALESERLLISSSNTFLEKQDDIL